MYHYFKCFVHHSLFNSQKLPNDITYKYYFHFRYQEVRIPNSSLYLGRLILGKEGL